MQEARVRPGTTSVGSNLSGRASLTAVEGLIFLLLAIVAF